MHGNRYISVIIADPQPVFREGIRSLLFSEREIRIVAEAGNMDELIAALSNNDPDILILDFNPRYFDQEKLTRMLEGKPKCKVVIISSQEKKWQAFKSLEFNVYCYLTKECGRADIVKAIKSTCKGEKFFCHFIHTVLLEMNGSSEEDLGCNPTILTKRELEITTYVAKGKKNKEIAEILCLSPHTIHTHRKNIMKKIGVTSASELTAYAINLGMI